MAKLIAQRAWARLVGFELFADDCEVWLVCRQAQHYEISLNQHQLSSKEGQDKYNKFLSQNSANMRQT